MEEDEVKKPTLFAVMASPHHHLLEIIETAAVLNTGRRQT
jgi:hypothetical protein